MSALGFSKAGLERLHRVLSGHVERGEMPGLVALVGRDDELHVETLGTLAVGSAAPMRHDTLFRVGSMVKPMAAAVTMMLLEECRLRLDDSIEPWLPELANRRVLRTIASPLDDTVPARRAITVRDLLTYRMGFGSIMAMPGSYPIQQAIRDLRIGGDGHPRPSQAPPTQEWLRGLGSLPLLAQPGERWMYHVSGDVLGVLLERVSGQNLGECMRQRLFEPLGMKDTAFHVPSSKLERLPPVYFRDYQAGRLEMFDDPADSAWHPQPAFESAAGGLISSLDDYYAFSHMMLQGGRHGGEQILSHASVEMMTSDRLLPEHRTGAELFFGSHSSWGFGMAVGVRREQLYGTPGRYGWDGGFGTSAYNDPVERLTGILLTQRMVDSPEPPRIYSDFWTLAYAAMA